MEAAQTGKWDGLVQAPAGTFDPAGLACVMIACLLGNALRVLIPHHGNWGREWGLEHREVCVPGRALMVHSLVSKGKVDSFQEENANPDSIPVIPRVSEE